METPVLEVVEGGVDDNRAMRRRRPGSTDVARLAGVSQKTVSRVFNNEPHVKDEVRQRVLQAARELGYRPNTAARALLSGRTRRIGVVALGSTLYGPASLLVGIERAARTTGYALSVVNTFEDEPRSIAKAIESLLDQGVDGIVLCEPIDEGPLHLDLEIPVLVLGTMPGLSAPTVIEMAGMAANPAMTATNHLLDLGHTTVHHIAGPQQWFSARDRLEGWRQALEDAGAPVPDHIEGNWTAPAGYEAGLRLLENQDMTAVFVANDDMAVGAIRAFTSRGLRVPDDVSVVGFDDIPTAAYLSPPLTTVLQPFDQVAQTGLTALVRAIEDPQDLQDMHMDSGTRLVIRESTAPPPATGGPAPGVRARRRTNPRTSVKGGRP
jgi:DNA-binding LacI/PurR family transcriptional regulator